MSLSTFLLQSVLVALTLHDILATASPLPATGANPVKLLFEQHPTPNTHVSSGLSGGTPGAAGGNSLLSQMLAGRQSSPPRPRAPSQRSSSFSSADQRSVTIGSPPQHSSPDWLLDVNRSPSRSPSRSPIARVLPSSGLGSSAGAGAGAPALRRTGSTSTDRSAHNPDRHGSYPPPLSPRDRSGGTSAPRGDLSSLAFWPSEQHLSSMTQWPSMGGPANTGRSPASDPHSGRLRISPGHAMMREFAGRRSQSGTNLRDIRATSPPAEHGAGRRPVSSPPEGSIFGGLEGSFRDHAPTRELGSSSRPPSGASASASASSPRLGLRAGSRPASPQPEASVHSPHMQTGSGPSALAGTGKDTGTGLAAAATGSTVARRPPGMSPTGLQTSSSGSTARLRRGGIASLSTGALSAQSRGPATPTTTSSIGTPPLPPRRAVSTGGLSQQLGNERERMRGGSGDGVGSLGGVPPS